ncbi:MAG: FMN-binding protein [Bacteroidales bacterium]|nr:FMN-binding protein [Bacteroidales bacterium]
MNTNSNVYTVVYTTVIVVLVAAILAVVSQSLKSKQDANEKADTISQMLTAAGFGTKDEFQKMGNEAVIAKYAEEIASAYTVNLEGTNLTDLSIENTEIYTPAMLKKQNYIIKGMQEGEVALPVFEFKNGVTVVPVYGAGLWGPIWGYIAFNEPKDGVITIKGAYFDHESETAGLGSRIKDDPAFQSEFVGEIPDFENSNVFEIVKGGSPKNADGSEVIDNKIDAITGATMTSRGLDKAIDTWLGAYSKHFRIGISLMTVMQGIDEGEAACETNTEEE